MAASHVQVKAWEDEHVSIPRASPGGTLRFLMEQHGLRQEDLADCAPQSRISEILNGRRSASKEVAKALAKRFRVSAEVFHACRPRQADPGAAQGALCIGSGCCRRRGNLARNAASHRRGEPSVTIGAYLNAIAALGLPLECVSQCPLQERAGPEAEAPTHPANFDELPLRQAVLRQIRQIDIATRRRLLRLDRSGRSRAERRVDPPALFAAVLAG